MKKKKKRTQNKVFELIKIVLYFALVLISLLFLATVKNSLIFPGKYIALIALVLLVVCIIILLFVLPKKYILNIFGILLIIICSGGIIFANYHINKSIKLIGSLFDDDVAITTYYVAVFEDSDVKDINGKKVAILNRNEDNVKKVLNSKYKIEIDSYMSIADLTTMLGNKEVDAIVISDSVFEYINEEQEENESKLIKLDEIVVESDVSKQREEFDVNKPFLMYIGGIDGWHYQDGVKISDVGLADVNILAAVNPLEHKILLINIPRDYYVQLHGTTGMRDKLTHAGMYGVEMSIMTIEDLFNLDIQTYVKVNYGAVVNLVNAIDGIDVYSDQAFYITSYPTANIKKGINHLNGDQALAFARTRKVLDGGDRHRGQNQQAIIEAIIKKVATNKKYLMKYEELVTTLDPYFTTDFKAEDAQALLKNQLETLSKWEVESIAVDGEGRGDYSYSFPKKMNYVMEPNMETVRVAREKILEILKEVE